MDEINDVTGPSIEAGTGTANTPSVTPSSTPLVDGYEARFKGLMQSNGQFLNTTGYQKFAEIPSQTQVEGWKTAAAKLNDLTTQLQQRDSEFQAASTALVNTQAFEAKTRLLASEAPELIGFVDEIPTLQDAEAQKGAIADFRAKLQKFSEGRMPLGASIPAGSNPPAGGNLTIEQRMQALLNERFEATQKGDKDKANTAAKNYYTLEQEYMRTQEKYPWAPPSTNKF